MEYDARNSPSKEDRILVLVYIDSEVLLLLLSA